MLCPVKLGCNHCQNGLQQTAICHSPLQYTGGIAEPRKALLCCYILRYRLIPKNASTPATINVIGNQCRTSALSKDTREAMTKIKPIPTIKIPNRLDIHHH